MDSVKIEIDPALEKFLTCPPVAKALADMQKSWASLTNRVMDISAEMFTQMILYGYAHEENREYVLERKRVIQLGDCGFEMHVAVFSLYIDNVFIDYVGAFNALEVRNGVRSRRDKVVLLEVLLATSEDLVGAECNVDDARFIIMRLLGTLYEKYAFV